MIEPQPRRRPMFVLGIDRSGTSLLSEVLFRWGAHPGALEQLPQADADNPQGYWEYKPMKDFVADLVASIGTSFWDPEFKTLVRRRASDPDWRQRALMLAAEMESDGRPWFWKEPNVSFLLPFFSVVFPDSVYLITLRNPCNSAPSYEKFFLPAALRDRIRLSAYFFLRWQYLMISIFEHLKDYRSKLIVPYESLVSAPREQCERISRFLASVYGPAAPSGPDTVDRMAATIDPALWRNRSGISFLEAPQASAAQKALYSYLASRTDGEVSDFDPARYPLPECAGEYLANMAVLRWLLQNL